MHLLKYFHAIKIKIVEVLITERDILNFYDSCMKPTFLNIKNYYEEDELKDRNKRRGDISKITHMLFLNLSLALKFFSRYTRT